MIHQDENLIFELINYYRPGVVQVGITTQLNCLFPDMHTHEDRKKSARVFSDGYYKCWGCGVYLDAISFVKEMENCGFMEAIQFIRENFGRDLLTVDSTSTEVLSSFEKYIINLVIELKPKNFNEIYEKMDQYIEEKDANKLNSMLERLVNERQARTPKDS